MDRPQPGRQNGAQHAASDYSIILCRLADRQQNRRRCALIVLAAVAVASASVWALVLKTWDNTPAAAGETLGRAPSQPGPTANEVSSRVEPPDARRPAVAGALAAPGGLPRELSTRSMQFRSDLDAEALAFHARFFQGFVDYFEEHYFRLPAGTKLRVFLFDDSEAYRQYTEAIKGPHTEYGYYLPSADVTVIPLRSGLGAAAHELVHHFNAKGFAAKPPVWADEMAATFFEKFIAHFDGGGRLIISFGYFNNWRFPSAKENIDAARLASLEEMDQSALNSLAIFLHKKGFFQRFVRRLSARRDDPTGSRTLQEVAGMDLRRLEAEWKGWVRSQPIDENVSLVPESFVKTDDQWQMWWTVHGGTLVWDERQQVYLVKTPPPLEL